jgi:hypothetical protein
VGELDPDVVQRGDGGNEAEPEPAARRRAALLQPEEAAEDLSRASSGMPGPSSAMTA